MLFALLKNMMDVQCACMLRRKGKRVAEGHQGIFLRIFWGGQVQCCFLKPEFVEGA